MSTHFDQALERIKKATGARTQVQLAEILGIRQSSISDAKRRNSVPADWFLKLYRIYGLNPDWLADGIEPVYLKPGMGKFPADQLVSESPAPYGLAQSRGRVVLVSSMAGAQSEKWENLPIGELNIPETFFRPSLVVVKMDGSSMEPIIRRGAFVGIDENQRRLLAGEIYAIQMPHQGMVLKRVYFDPESNRFILRAEDKNHPELSFPADEREARTIGRVIWVLQEL